MVIEVEAKHLTLNNNCSILINDSQREYLTPIRVECPKHEADNVYLTTNSDFSKVERVVDYVWPSSLGKVNWLAVHRSKPYIAYVVQPDYNEAIRNRKMIEEIDPKKQMVRIHNYHNQKRGLVKPSFSASITDLAFAYISVNAGHENRLAIVDKGANVQIHEFIANDDQSKSITTLKLLEITAEEKFFYQEVRLSWCPGHILERDEGDDDDIEDLGMNLGVSFDNNAEIYAAGHIIRNGIRHLSKEELDFASSERKIIKDPGDENVISLALSNDLTTVCTASRDNRIRFYEISETSVRQVHNWEPKMRTGDNLSCIFFLDDFNELLENQDSHFWGHVLIGTVQGDLTIWNLNSWKPIQKVSLSCSDDNESSKFEYRIDVTSHILVAVHGESAFLAQLDFSEMDEIRSKDSYPQAAGADDGKTILPVKEPRIKKITRFQLYNPILSFHVKRSSLSEVEIFWMTQKSLEKCVINTDNLVVEEKTSNMFLSFGDLSQMAKDYDDKRMIYQSHGANGAERDQSHRISMKDFESPPVTLAEIFNTSSRQHGSSVCLTSSTNPSGEVKTVSSLMDVSISHRPSSPTSREVATYLSNEVDKLAKNFRETTFLQSSQIEPHLKNLLTESMMREFEANITSSLNEKVESLKKDIAKVNTDIVSLRTEMKDPSQLKNSTKIIDDLIKKLMSQMNQAFAKGLGEFLLQIKGEVAEISNTVNLSQASFLSQINSMNKQIKQCENQIQELCKQTSECSKRQQEIVTQLQIQHQEIQAAAAAAAAVASSPANSLRDRQLLRLSFNTPPPGDANRSLWMMNPDYEEERRRKAEEEKTKKLNQIWTKIKSENSKLVMEAISSAFELKDQSLIKEICEYYHKTKGAAYLMNLIDKDQAILLSFLSNFASSDLREDWKISFITKILPQLDIKSPLVKDWFPRFDTKLISRLQEAEQTFGDSMPDITLVLRILELYRIQCKSS
ncbi:enhancer of mRNA-decapping protein 4 homolog Ge-1 [Brevipalpus obovatus]|uniref:enhancer of mRNA-decapping protein 4 homolog Ge-1 n=1 Tax=Brevipalpus obovatus TaxID=246614 RepID=UPI003D9ECD2D